MSGQAGTGQDGESATDNVAMRLLVAAVVGVAAGTAVGAVAGWQYLPTVGWIGAAVVYLALTWFRIRGLDENGTKAHARQRDSSLSLSEGLIVLASVASLAGVGHLLVAGSATGIAADIAALVGVLSVVASWVTVHTVFTLLYARKYYDASDGRPEGGVDFGDDAPTYVDFAYLAFTLGMTYQVSDTTLQNRDMRRTALKQALLSYVLGAVVLAITINLVVNLGH